MAMNVLVIGSGGREHALAARLAASASVSAVVVCPGNGGTDSRGLVSESGDPAQVAQRLRPGLIVIGPEAPLCDGLADRLREAGWLVYGPSAAAAELEGSKAYMKAFAERHGIRTAKHVTVTAPDQLDAALAQFADPPVVKASGLCAGKGVVVAESFEEARREASRMLSGEAFGSAGREVVIEERLLGSEVSIHAVCDGQRGFMLPAIQDHKRIGDGDTGPNTGGMGTYGPAALVEAQLAARIQTEIIDRTLQGMRAEGRPFVGTLFAGLMVSPSGEPVLLEINVRFGDPETQVLMNLLDGDFAELLCSAARGELNPHCVSTSARYGLCVVIAAAGYPSEPRRGDVIRGLDEADAVDGVSVYHAGTQRKDGQVVSAGGRVLGVTAVAPSLERAFERAYRACKCIHFDGMQYRRDIGYRQLGSAAVGLRK